MSRFEDKTVIITGAGSGLGRAAAERVGAEGANLMLVDIDAEGLDATRRDRGGRRRRPRDTRVADVGRRDGGPRLRRRPPSTSSARSTGSSTTPASRASRTSPRTSAPPSSHGCCRSTSTVSSTAWPPCSGNAPPRARRDRQHRIGRRDPWRRQPVRVLGVEARRRRAHPQLRRRVRPVRDLDQRHRPRRDHDPDGRGSLKQIDPENWQEVGKQFVSVNPMQRFGEAHEVAALAAFLLSGEAPFINGAVITIDGGQSYKY